jgi:hypothetical protein
MTSILFCTIFTCKDNSAFKLNKAYYYLICKVDYGYNNKKTFGIMRNIFYWNFIDINQYIT